MVNEGIALRIFNLGTNWVLVVSFKPRPLCHCRKNSHNIGQETDRSQEQYLTISGIEPGRAAHNLIIIPIMLPRIPEQLFS